MFYRTSSPSGPLPKRERSEKGEKKEGRVPERGRKREREKHGWERWGRRLRRKMRMRGV